jgi:hypothetical protein
VRPGEPDEEPKELLEPNVKVATARVTPAINHRSGFDVPSICQSNTVGQHLDHVGLEQDAVTENTADDLVKPFRGDRIVATGHHPKPARKAQLVPVPGAHHQRLHPRPLLRGEIRVVKRPRVIGTERRLPLDHHDRSIGVRTNPAKGNKAVGKATAYEKKVRSQLSSIRP